MNRRASASAVSAMLPPLTFIVLSTLESVRPLRAWVESRLIRVARNLVIAASSALVIGVVERPIVLRVSKVVEKRRLGLLPRLRLPRAIEAALGALWLDYTLYVWHVLTHKSGPLWLLHRVHHADRDLDVSTAVRFHPLEMLLSVPWRVTQVAVFGISPRIYGGWQRLLALSIFFHHSNVRLPAWFERPLSRLIMTPRLHGIHHANREHERNCNWSSGLSLWDLVHGTWRSEWAAKSIAIGVEGFDAPEDVSLGRMLQARDPHRLRPGRRG